MVRTYNDDLRRKLLEACDAGKGSLRELAMVFGVSADWEFNIVGALSISGMLASMTVEAATDGDAFFAFLDHSLCPKLRPGDVLVMDNVSVRKVEGVRQRVEAVGARLL